MRLVIVDTACGNLASVLYALQRLGYQPQITRDPQQISQADKLILPGVGSAQIVMQELQPLLPLLQECRQPLLGICLGMQLMGSYSEEIGLSEQTAIKQGAEEPIATLGIIDAPVRRLTNHGLPLPHCGWNRVHSLPDHPLFRQIAQNSHFYFVHGYAMPLCASTIGQTHYGDSFSAAVQRDNFFGVQFHPERSGAIGSQLLKNFMDM